ncbi:MAG: glycine--tRNA ligase [Deltaproteobacteria bacterium CG11_big_fil_rev_8_21_14_0_20_47_16]|nr:MAG: glycine--tRNA ligase [Deltaproteobacteria bacterium CG11_big_fil_rev_8_21_14_0_20_47_16]
MVDMETLTSLCKRRGLIFQSSEIYGGINGFWDYGPLGVELKRRIKEHWWRYMVLSRDNVVGVDTSIIAHPQTWVASGHVANFSDPMVDCKKCKRRFRTDEFPEGTKACPDCGGELTEARSFNLMFETHVGATVDSGATAYLRPETCQSIFTQFKNVLATSRQKLPFGIAQVGKAFRNEITPRNFIFRSREFEQMEMEFFCKLEDSQEWYDYWVNERLSWFHAIGIKKESLRLRPHASDELAHYAKGCTDVEFEMPFGWSEMEGIANRTNYDLTQHQTVSGKDLQYFDEASKSHFIPAVVESSVGVDRTLLCVLVDAYYEDDVEGDKRVVMRFHPSIAPVQVAILPLSKKLDEPARKLRQDLRLEFLTDYDDAGSIGRRYRRQDEVGTPLAVTVDFQTLEDNAVTVRHRDTTKQDRVALDQLKQYLRDKMQEWK